MGLVDQLQQSRAWPEIGNALGVNLNLAAGLRIAPHTASALTDGKGAKPLDLDSTALTHGLENGFKDRLVVLHPACFSAVSCRAVDWSSMETRA